MVHTHERAAEEPGDGPPPIPGDSLRRILTTLAIATVLAGAFLVAAPAKQAQAAADGDWACSVPSAFTWDAKRNEPYMCGPGGKSYRLRTPADNLTACATHSGFTYDLTATSPVCDPYSYRLRTPADNLWACSLSFGISPPFPGFTYDAVRNNFDCGSFGGVSYHFKTAVTGLWACLVPAGFSWDATRASTACHTSGSAGYTKPSYRLIPPGLLRGSATGDAMADFILTDGDGRYSVATSNGQGLGGPGSSVWLTGWGNTASSQVGDFNGDRKTDLIVPNTDTNTWDVALSNGWQLGVNGTGVWLTSAIKIREWSGVGDFNGDFKSDLIVPSGKSNYVVATSDGQRLGPAQSVWLTGWENSPNTHVGDFNGDRKSDLIAYNPATGGWDVALSDGTRLGAAGSGRWLTGWGTDASWSRVGDFNGDGNSDLIVHQGGDKYSVALSDGTKLGAPGTSVWLNGWGSNFNTQVGDFNGDRMTDVIVPDSVYGGWHVALSDGARLGASGSGPWLTGWTTDPKWARAM